MAKSSDKPNTIVVYVDVGQLPPAKITAAIDEVKALNATAFQALEADGHKILFLPVRPNSNTRVECIAS